MSAALYCRSTKDRSDVSIDAQVRLLTEYAETRGLKVVHSFEDPVQRGSNEDRPAFRELTAAIKNRQRGWSHLLVLDTSRIARGRFIAQAFKRECAKYGVEIHFKNLPDVDPISKVILESVFEAMDEVHSIMSREKGLAGMAENVRQGFRAGGRAPLGYQLAYHATGAMRDGKPVTKSQLALGPGHEMVRAYMVARASGTPRTIAMRESGINVAATSLVGIEWNALVYAGHTVWNRHQETDRHGHRTGHRMRPRAEWLVTRDTHPALITDVQAERIMSALETSDIGRRVRAAKAQRAGFVLAGLLQTSEGELWTCRGANQYRLKAAGRERGRLVPSALIEDPVLQQVERDLRSDLFIRRLLAALQKDTQQPGSQASIRSEIARLTRLREKSARMALAAEDGGVYAELVKEHTRQIEAMQRELVAMQASVGAHQDAQELTADDIRRELDHAGVRELVPLVVNRVVLEPDLTCRVEYGGKCPSMASPQGRVDGTPLYSVVQIKKAA